MKKRFCMGSLLAVFLAAGVLSGTTCPPGGGILPVTDEIVMGANVWNNWKNSEAGGSGTTLSDDDYGWSRCKGCHGWDWLDGQGGYVRRTATAGHPAGNLANALGTGVYTDAQVQGAGGRVPGVAANDQTHPDFTTLLTPAQIAAVVAFLNFADAQFSSIAQIDTTTDPVTYTFPSADTANGQTLYTTNCQGCHGAPDADSTAVSDNKPGTGGIKAYLGKDGKYSELAHKARWGGGGTMTRAAAGNLTSTEVRDLLAYLKTVVEAVGGGGDATAGATFFTNNNCATCHCATAVGGCAASAPDIRTKTAAEVLAQLDGTNTHTGGTVAGVTQADADNVAAWLATQ